MVLKDFAMLNVDTTPSVRPTLASTSQQVCGATPAGGAPVGPFLMTAWADATVGIAATRDDARRTQHVCRAPRLVGMTFSFHG
jgi:hypothetical protein